jgi:hypothetical protein
MSNSTVGMNRALVIQVLDPAYSRLPPEYNYTTTAKYNAIKHWTGTQNFMTIDAFFWFYRGKKKIDLKKRDVAVIIDFYNKVMVATGATQSPPSQEQSPPQELPPETGQEEARSAISAHQVTPPQPQQPTQQPDALQHQQPTSPQAILLHTEQIVASTADNYHMHPVIPKHVREVSIPEMRQQTQSPQKQQPTSILQPGENDQKELSETDVTAFKECDECDDFPEEEGIDIADDNVEMEVEVEEGDVILQPTIPHNWKETRVMLLEYQKNAGNYTIAMSTTNLLQSIVAWHSGMRSWQPAIVLEETTDNGFCLVRFGSDPNNEKKINLRLIKNVLNNESDDED